VFDRFYRAIGSRSQPGSGLGLAIVAKAAADHGGTTFVANASDGGAIVGFDIPTP
jgi:two-component system sensor histidine kinase MprB